MSGPPACREGSAEGHAGSEPAPRPRSGVRSLRTGGGFERTVDAEYMHPVVHENLADPSGPARPAQRRWVGLRRKRRGDDHEAVATVIDGPPPGRTRAEVGEGVFVGEVTDVLHPVREILAVEGVLHEEAGDSDVGVVQTVRPRTERHLARRRHGIAAVEIATSDRQAGDDGDEANDDGTDDGEPRANAIKYPQE